VEKELLACALASREDYDLIVSYISPKSSTYSKEFQVVLGKIGEYYDRDKEATTVGVSVLAALLADSVRSDKLASRLEAYVNEAAATSVSITNVRAVLLLAKQQEVADRLAAALVGGDEGARKVDSLIEELQELRSRTTIDDAEDEEDVLVDVDLTKLMEKEYDPDNVIEIYPRSINDRLDAGARPGHHITVFGLSNIGKTGFVVNIGAGVARQGKRILHLINEDRAQDVYVRYVSNLSGMDKHAIRDDPAKASELAKSNGLANVVVINIKPGTPEQISHYIDKYKPDAVIVDQLRNLQVRAESRVNQLEMAATAVRNIGKRKNVLMISVTQASDSARDKIVLDSGDIDFSNVGIPAQADILIGIGVNAQLDAENLRQLTLVKNKVGGQEDNFPVRINKLLSRYTSV